MPVNHRAVLKSYIERHGLKASRQRDVIVDVFFKAGGHLKVEEVFVLARASDPKISQATVYRTMKLMTECGLAEVRHFMDGQARYEVSEGSGEHHDHLICTECEAIVEFVDKRIEDLQEKVAKSYGFTVTQHKMELYGVCAACVARGKKV